MSSKVKVFVRIRPFLEGEQTSETILVNESSLKLLLPDREARMFKFDGIFTESYTQEYVYYKSYQPYTYAFLQGSNVCTFCYGQTSSGKSHTCGFQHKIVDGIVLRTFEDIFMNGPVELYVSFYYIYNEKLDDLLRPASKLVVRESGKNYFEVSGLYYARITSLEYVLYALQAGMGNRKSAPTLCNMQSSRSHTILQIDCAGSRMMILDLAGSERVKKSKSEGIRLEEAININQSLTCLGNVISCLSKDDSAHIPLRESALTKVLSKSLLVNSRTTLIATVCPTENAAHESLSTLQFASRCKMISIPNNIVFRSAANITEQEMKIVREFRQKLGVEGTSWNDADVAQVIFMIKKEQYSQFIGYYREAVSQEQIRYEGLLAYYKYQLELIKQERDSFKESLYRQFSSSIATKPKLVKNGLSQNVQVLYQIILQMMQQIEILYKKMNDIVDQPRIKTQRVAQALDVVGLQDGYVYQVLTEVPELIKKTEQYLYFKDHICAAGCQKCKQIRSFAAKLVKVAASEGLYQHIFGTLLNKDSKLQIPLYEPQKQQSRSVVSLPDSSYFASDQALVDHTYKNVEQIASKLYSIDQVLSYMQLVRRQNEELRIIAIQTVSEHALDLLNMSKLLQEHSARLEQAVSRSETKPSNSSLVSTLSQHYAQAESSYLCGNELERADKLPPRPNREKKLSADSSDEEFDQLAAMRNLISFQ